MTDRDIITGYHETAIIAGLLLHGIEWNRRHGLLLQNLIEQVEQMQRELFRFEMIMDAIPDRRVRNVIRCRYALGMTETETAEFLGLSRGTIARIISDTLNRFS